VSAPVAKKAPATARRDFADVSYDEAMARARAMVPGLRSRAAHAEDMRSLLPETEAELHANGLLRMTQPRRWGGMELPWIAMFELPAEIGRGCASTAWNLANLAIHHWMLALYDERAQDEVWKENPDALIASGIAYPQGRARRADGGFVIDGYWNFSSGVDGATWNMLAVTVKDGEKVVDPEDLPAALDASLTPGTEIFLQAFGQNLSNQYKNWSEGLQLTIQ